MVRLGWWKLSDQGGRDGWRWAPESCMPRTRVSMSKFVDDSWWLLFLVALIPGGSQFLVALNSWWLNRDFFLLPQAGFHLFFPINSAVRPSTFSHFHQHFLLNNQDQNTQHSTPRHQTFNTKTSIHQDKPPTTTHVKKMPGMGAFRTSKMSPIKETKLHYKVRPTKVGAVSDPAIITVNPDFLSRPSSGISKKPTGKQGKKTIKPSNEMRSPIRQHPIYNKFSGTSHHLHPNPSPLTPRSSHSRLPC